MAKKSMYMMPQTQRSLVTRQAILRGWLDKDANLYRIPLIPIFLNNNTITVLVCKPPTKFLPDHPPPTDTVHNVYKLKTQPELVWYLHAAAGFSTKPTWLAAIKTSIFESWLGLTIKAVTKYHPEYEETMKGHRRKGQSGLRSTKSKTHQLADNRSRQRQQAGPPKPQKIQCIHQSIFS